MKGIKKGRRFAFGSVFSILGVALLYAAVQADTTAAIVALSWFAANAMTLSFAYFINWPGVFGKTAFGTLHWGNSLFMLPLRLIIGITWRLQNMLFASPRYSEVAPDLFVGRICEFKSLPERVTMLVDLTSEFQTPASIRRAVKFRCLPTLDGCPPNWESLQTCLESIGADDRIYVCCANGHGRSVTFMAALLGLRGICHSASEAVKFIQAARPSAAPNQDQISFLEHAFQSMNPTQTAVQDLPRANEDGSRSSGAGK